MSLFPRMTPWHVAHVQPTRHEFSPFVNLFNDTFAELQRLSDTFPAMTQSSFAPKFDVKESTEAYSLEGELPGINQKDLSIEFSDDEQTLTIKGHTEHSREEGSRPTASMQGSVEAGPADGHATGADKPVTGAAGTEVVPTTGQDSKAVTKDASAQHHRYWVSERSVGSFQRSFSFPNRVDPEHVKASLKNGILSVVVPKVTKQQTAAGRKIPIASD